MGRSSSALFEGQVYKIHTFQNSLTGEMDTLYYQLDSGKDVFIIYSDTEAEVYDDKFETDYNGRYYFEYLRKGEEAGKVTVSSLSQAAELIQSFKQVAVDQLSYDKLKFNLRANLKDIFNSL